MYAKIVGFRRMSFTGQGGQKVEGTKIHYTYQETGTEGEKAENAFLSESRMQLWGFKPYVGQEINIEYNRYGKVQEVCEA